MFEGEENDRILLKRIEERDEAAFKIFFERYYVRLSAFAYRFIGDETDSSTIVSDLLLTLWTYPESFRSIYSLSAYLYKSVRNRCVDYLRRKKSLSLLKETAFDYFVPEDEILERLIRQELMLKLEAAVEKLPENTKKVFCLSRKEHLSYAQIAEHLGISLNTVKYHMKNALVLLRRELCDYLLSLLMFIFLS